MSQSERDREIDAIKQMLTLLARRKYVLKSELLKMLPACRITGFSIRDLEGILFSIIDESVSYIDDTPLSDPLHACVSAQKELKKHGYTDLFHYLSVEEDSTPEEIASAYQRRQITRDEENLYHLAGLIIRSTAALDLYRDVCLAEVLFDELALRQRFGLPYLSPDERDRLTNRLVLDCGMEIGAAKRLVECGMSEFGFVITEQRRSETPKQEEAQEEVLDEYLIPVRGAASEKSEDRIREKGQDKSSC